MAKGVEDTALYVFNRLTPLNEVGGHPEQFGVSAEQFHAANQERLQSWPHSQLATSTVALAALFPALVVFASSL